MWRLRDIISLVLLCFSLSSVAQGWEVQEIVGKRGVNEICPAFFDNGIVYMSNDRARYATGYSDADDQRLYDLYYLDTSGGKEPVSFEKVVNTFNHEGPATFGRGDSLMIFTRNRVLTRKYNKGDGPNNLVLFSASRKGGGWSSPEMIDLNLDGYNVMHPALSPDGNVLLFSSDADNGHGGFDLYLSSWVDGEWITPVNMGPFLNTEFDETFPSFLDDQTIVFASNRESGMGGLDLYMAYWVADSIFVEHFPEPINSKYDDFSLISDGGINKGYFSSNRSKHSDDIYYFEYDYPEFGECEKNHKPKFCYNLRDAEDIGSDSIPVKHMWDFGDGKSAMGRNVRHCYDDTGQYDIHLSLVDTTTGMHYLDVASYGLTIERFKRPYIKSPDSLEVGEVSRFTVDNAELPEGDVLGVYWRFRGEYYRRNNMAFYSFDSEGYHDVDVAVVLKEGSDTVTYCSYKTIVVGEATGRLAESNMDTTDAVYEKAKPWILTVQITETSEKMDTSDAYFAKVNKNIRVVYDEEEKKYSYQVEASRELADVYDTYKELLDSGYTDAQIIAYDKSHINSMLDTTQDLSVLDLGVLTDEMLNEGVSVYFGFDSYVIGDSSSLKIRNYIDQFENKRVAGFIVEGFTDPKGNLEYNLMLSRKRAVKVASYLMSMGIPRDRIRIVDNSEHFDPKVYLNSEEWERRRVRIIELVGSK